MPYEAEMKKIQTSYAKAKTLVSQNNAKEAYACVEDFLKSAYGIYQEQIKKCEDITKTKEYLNKWGDIALVLRDKGITDEVLQAFDLKLEEKSDESKPKNSGEREGSLIRPKDPEQGWAAEIFEKYKTAVVSLLTNTSSGMGSGTGFIISSKGFLLTNDHVIDDKTSVTMSFIDGKKSYNLQTLATDRNLDVALCKFELTDISAFSVVPRIKDYSRVKQGADIVVIGNGLSMGLAPHTGIIKYVHSNVNGDLIYTAPSNPGDSGAPVFNRSGECIGIHKSSQKEAKGIAYATPMDKIEELLRKWIQDYNITL